MLLVGAIRAGQSVAGQFVGPRSAAGMEMAPPDRNGRRCDGHRPGKADCQLGRGGFDRSGLFARLATAVRRRGGAPGCWPIKCAAGPISMPSERRRRQLTLVVRWMRGWPVQPRGALRRLRLALRILAAAEDDNELDSEIIYACDLVLRAGAARAAAVVGVGGIGPVGQRPSRIGPVRGKSIAATGRAAGRQPAPERGGNARGQSLRAAAGACPRPSGVPWPATSRHDCPRPTLARWPAMVKPTRSWPKPRPRSSRTASRAKTTEEDAGDEAAAVLRWMFALRSNDPNRRQRARGRTAVARFRGLAARAGDATDRSRSERAARAGRIAAVDARRRRPHLAGLAQPRSASPDVRLAAMSVMATTGDPDICAASSKWPAATPIRASSAKASSCSRCSRPIRRTTAAGRVASTVMCWAVMCDFCTSGM